MAPECSQQSQVLQSDPIGLSRLQVLLPLTHHSQSTTGQLNSTSKSHICTTLFKQTVKDPFDYETTTRAMEYGANSSEFNDKVYNLTTQPISNVDGSTINNQGNDKPTIYKFQTDPPYDDLNYGDRSCSLTRNVFLRRKAPFQIIILSIILLLAVIMATITLVSIMATRRLSRSSINDGSNNSNSVSIGVVFSSSASAEPLPVPSADSLTITLAADLKKLKSNPVKYNTVIIEALLDTNLENSIQENELDLLSPNETDSIQILRITGPITEDWVQYLLTKFSKVENLTIDINELCIGAKVRNRDSLQAITLKNVKIFKIQNSYLCQISSWVFRWEVPQITELQVSNSDFSEIAFDPMYRFVEKCKGTLNHVLVYKCYLCSKCSLSDIQYSKVQNVKISDAKKSPIVPQKGKL